MKIRPSLFIKSILIFVICLNTVILFAQNIDGGDVTKLNPPRPPESYSNPKGFVEKKNCKRRASGDGIWFVYSDRESNQTYADKACQARPLSKLSFNQVCIVADETDEAIRVVLYNLSDKAYEEKGRGKISFTKNAEDYGWIKKSNMLLWDRSIEDSLTNYSKKAVSVTTIEEAANITSKIKRGLLELYEAPIADPKYRTSKDIKLFQYLFVFKEENGMVLLGSNNYFSRNSISFDILGWAKKSSLHVWNSAICLRINFDPEAEADRDANKFNVKFFRTPEQAKDYRDGKPINSNLPFKFNDPTEGPSNDNPYYYGFPILDNKEVKDDIYNTGYVTNTLGKNGESIFTSERQANYNKIWQEIQAARDNINIVFVADGALKTYFKTFANALDASATIGSKQATKNDYKLGSVIYNDASCGDDDFIVKPLTGDKDRLITWLGDESQTQTPCNLNRDIQGAPLYDALLKACSMFDDSKTTNVIIMLGSSSSVNKELKDKVIQALTKKQAYMYFFQAAYKDGKVYDDFFRDCKDFLQMSSDKIDEHFATDIASKKYEKAKLVEKGDNYELVNTAIPGTFYAKDKGEIFAQNEVTSRIKTLLMNVEKRINNLLSQYESRTVGTGSSVTEVDQTMKKEFELLWKDKGLSPEALDQLANQDNFQLFLKAYTSLTCQKLKYPVLNKVLFLSDKEFSRLEDAFDRLNRSEVTSSQRDNLISAFQQIIINYKGGSADLTTMANKPLDYFMNLLTGLNYTTRLFQKKLADLKDEKKTPAQEIDKLKDQFYRISKKLQDLKKNKKARFDQDDATFYWVPENIFQID